MPTLIGEHFWEYTDDELLDEGELLARSSSLHCSFLEAVMRVKDEELEGTLFASKIMRNYFLIGG
jgi:hypothetical protein